MREGDAPTDRLPVGVRLGLLGVLVDDVDRLGERVLGGLREGDAVTLALAEVAMASRGVMARGSDHVKPRAIVPTPSAASDITPSCPPPARGRDTVGQGRYE